MITPRKMPETGALRNVWKKFNELLEYSIATRPASGLNVRLKQTSRGVIINAEKGIQTRTTEAPSSIKRCKVISVEGDYLGCRSEMSNGTVDDNETIFYVAKPHFLRVSVLNGLTIDGWSVAASSPGNSRTLTNLSQAGVSAGLIVTQKLNYPYAVDNTIYATEPIGKTAVNNPDDADEKLTWLDLNVDARNFHQTRIMLNACVLVGGVPTTKLIVFEAGPVP